MNDLIVSGLETRPRSYARAPVEEGGKPTKLDLDSLWQQVITFFNSKGISMDSNDIEACHPLPRKNKSEKPAVRFVSRKQKKSYFSGRGES